MTTQRQIRLAIVVSHPIQYYVPLYQRLSERDDVTIKVFFTWHAAERPVKDRGFDEVFAWDIPLTEGYPFEMVPNVASDPGTHHFFGLNNPSLVKRVLAWRPDVVHITGWAWLSHLGALRAFRRHDVPTIFRGDSHLLDRPRQGPGWWLKRAVVGHVYALPDAFLVVGQANRVYYEALGVDAVRLYDCCHSIDVRRFAADNDRLEREAQQLREQLRISDSQPVVLFAGKFQPKKRPLELMDAFRKMSRGGPILMLVGGGELEDEVRRVAANDPSRFRVLPFQNQRRMPVIYRAGDVFVLPSAFEETWGLAVNEALACGRPAVVSDRVGCAADVIDSTCGRVFPWRDLSAMMSQLNELTADRNTLLAARDSAARRAWAFDVSCTEAAMMKCIREWAT